MAYNDFIKFATNHRNLLETAIKKYPTALKPSDLVEFDQVILESKKELRKEGLLEEWMPAVTFNCPEDYLYANAEEIFLESYLGPNYQNILIEQISGEIPVADINAAMKSQIEALKNLADWYNKLPPEQRLKLERETVDSTKSRKTFMEELKDLESEINGIYGKLTDKPTTMLGKMANWAKQKISGRLQRGVGAAFGAGEVAKTALEEQKMFEELFGNDQVNEQVGSAIAKVGNTALSGIKQVIPHAIQHVSKFKKAANAVQIAHQQAAQTAAAAAKTGGAAASGAGTAGTGTAAATGAQTAGAGAKGAAIAGKGAFAKLAAFAGAHPIGVAAGIGALVAAGAAGIKMRNRRKRIETLQAVARNAGAGGSVVTPPVESEAEKAAPPGGTGTGGATKTINVFAGKGGTGLQSTIAQKINNSITDPTNKTKAFKSSTKLLNALKKDLETAGFNVLEEGATAKQPIEIPNTVAVLIEIERDNPDLFKILRTKLLNLFNANNINAINAPVLAGAGAKKTKKKEEMVKNAKSLLSGIHLNKDHTFTKPEWDLLNTVADDPEIGGTYREAPVGRKIVKDKSIESDGSVKFDNTTENFDMKKLKDYGNVMESLRRKYSLGLITLKEYNTKKQQLDNLVLKEEIKRQIKSLVKK